MVHRYLVLLNNLSLIDGSVNTADIADGAITSSKLAIGAVLTTHFASSGNNKVLTTNSSGVVTWSDQSALPDASPSNETITSMSLSGNSLEVTEAGTIKTQSLNGLSINGDVTGTIATSSVTKIQGRNVSSTAPTDKQILQWDGTTNQWVPKTIAVVSAPEHYYSVDPADFTSLKRDDQKDKNNMIIYEDNTTFVTVFKRAEGGGLIAPLHLPHGATITEATLYYIDNDAGDISVAISRRSFMGVNQTLGSWTSSTSLSSIRSAFIIPSGSSIVVDNSQYSYRIDVRLDQSADANTIMQATHRIYGLRIKYTL